MIEQRDDKRSAAHLSKLFTRGAKSQLLDPLEKLLCCSYNLSLTCCIYWITDLSAACQDTFNMSIITTGLNYSGISCLCWTSSCITYQVSTFDMWRWKEEVAALYWDIMSDWISVKTCCVFTCFADIVTTVCSEWINKMNKATSSVVSGQHINTDLVAAVQTLSICCDLHSWGSSLSTRQQCLSTTKQGRPIKKSPWELIAKKIQDTYIH